ncbi:hypothetical protein [Halalkalibacillus halophilus]|uniref:hypothetical protein n=1 Tax=Halalkalibacillus halophilus TaxID=392827 RepID=UPI00040EB334|nr:hypothetical protein [Halalkalibacillus halophilus]
MDKKELKEMIHSNNFSEFNAILKNSKWRGAYTAILTIFFMIIIELVTGSPNIFRILGYLTGGVIALSAHLLYIKYRKSKNSTNQ